MKFPEKAPPWHQYISDIFKNNWSSNPEVMALVSKANGSEYAHWDKVKYLPRPEGMSPEEAWACVQISRLGRQQIPLQDKNGRGFVFWLPKSMMEALHRIDRDSAGQILVESENLSESLRKRYIISSLMEEAIASSQVEGAATSREVAKKILREGRKPRDASERMIVNNYRAMEAIKPLIKEKLSTELLNNLHRVLTKDILDEPAASGRFRKEEEVIHVVDESDDTTLHIPPPADQLSERMAALCEFANQDESEDAFIHPVVKAIILHFWIGYVHPYVDGNGRTARALFYWYMLKNGYRLFEFIAISRVLRSALQQYKRAYLYTESDENDLTYFVAFNVRVIVRALQDAREHISQKQREVKQSIAALKGYPGINLRQRTFLTELLRDSERIQTIRSFMVSYGVAYQTARTDLLDLMKRGLLQKLKSGKEFIFVAAVLNSSGNGTVLSC